MAPWLPAEGPEAPRGAGAGSRLQAGKRQPLGLAQASGCRVGTRDRPSISKTNEQTQTKLFLFASARMDPGNMLLQV